MKTRASFAALIVLIHTPMTLRGDDIRSDLDPPRAHKPGTKPPKAADMTAPAAPAPGGPCLPNYIVAAPGEFSGHSCDGSDSCTVSTGEEEIYQVSIPDDALWHFSTCNQAAYDTLLNIGSTCCGAEIASADDAPGCGGLTTSVCVPLTAGDYFVNVEGYQLQCGDYTLTIEKGTCGDGNLDVCEECDDGNTIPGDGCNEICQSVPVNDACIDSVEVTEGLTEVMTLGATTDGPDLGSCGFFGDGVVYNDIWYDFVSPCTADVTFSTCDDLGAGAEFDTRLAVYEGCDCPATPDSLIGCNDDDSGNACGGSPSFQSTLTVPLVSGTCYKVQVGGFNESASGAAELLVECPCVSDEDCDDGTLCNGIETCVSGGCVPGTPIVCDDGIECTTNVCDPATAECSFEPDNGACDDGIFCDGAEICDAALGCVAGTAVDCDDDISCTIDTCDEATDACEHTADDALCDDGLFCTGVDTCDPVLDCVISPDPCPGQLCNEADHECFDPDFESVIYVNANAVGGDGSSWSSAFNDLQMALSLATGPTAIWVAEGTYRPTECFGGTCDEFDRSTTFEFNDGISIVGGFAGTESSLLESDPDAHETILSCDLLGNDVAGFNNYEDNCRHVVTLHTSQLRSKLYGVIIEGGNADGQDNEGIGAGIYAPDFTIALVSACTIRNNKADYGGGLGMTFFSQVILEQCSLINNRGASGGGGVYGNLCFPSIVNCLFAENEAFFGGALYTATSEGTLVNCTMSNNAVVSEGGALWIDGRMSMVNSIVYGNIPDDYVFLDPEEIDVSYSLIPGTFQSIGMFDANPRFINPASRNFALRYDSPIIDAGKNSADISVITPDIQPIPLLDVRRDLRFVDAPGVPDCPQPLGVCGAPPVIDIGAFEYAPQPCLDFEICADGDSNGLRDDICIWWECANELCVGSAVMFADMGGQFGDCRPDGAADGNDRFHALNCFANTDILGTDTYPCELNAPNALNTDTGGPFGDCTPDGVCDANDAFHAVRAFQGTSQCSCAQAGTPSPEVTVVEATTLRLVPRQRRIAPGATVEIDILLDAPLEDLRGYQLHVNAAGGSNGRLELVDLSIEHRRDAVFFDLATWHAFNLATAQLAVGLDQPGVAAPADGYLATLTYRASREAAGPFIVDVLYDQDDGSGRTFLFPSADGKIAIDETAPASITVERH